MADPADKGDRPKRNRIIINLERAREAAHLPRMPSRGSRGAKILGIIAALLLLLVIVLRARRLHLVAELQNKTRLLIGASG